jgi:hypothetical protein
MIAKVEAEEILGAGAKFVEKIAQHLKEKNVL